MRKLFFLSILSLTLLGAGCAQKPAAPAGSFNSYNSNQAQEPARPETGAPPADEPADSQTAAARPVVIFSTNKGDITIELLTDKAPNTAANFLKLAKDGFYDNTKFHRVIKDFMVQGGDPLSKDANPDNDGTGGPGYFIEDEFYAGASNLRATVAMANAGPNTGGSQFFINISDNTFLDYDKQPLSSKHPVFGKIVDGMAVVDAIANIKTTGQPYDRPLAAIVIEGVTIQE